MLKQRKLVFLIILSVCFYPAISGCILWQRGTSDSLNQIELNQAALKKRVAVMPFQNNTDVGTAELGRRISSAIAEKLANTGKIIVVPRKEVEAYMSARGILLPLTQNTAMLVGRGLKLNAVVTGAISGIDVISKRTGWRILIPILKKQEYISASLVTRLIDVENGTFLMAEAGTGDTAHGTTEDLEWIGSSKHETLSQEDVNRSLNLAIDSLTRSLLETLIRAPWKGFIKSVSRSTATIYAGKDVGVKPGDRFVVYDVAEKITNVVGKTYLIPGKIKATLEVTRVMDNISEAKIISGQVLAGDAVHFAG